MNTGYNASPPTITLNELMKRADQYAASMVDGLEEHRKKYPHAKGLTDEERTRAAEREKEYPGPYPGEFYERYRRLYCVTMTEHYEIIEDASYPFGVRK
jgi:hypothetical protein